MNPELWKLLSANNNCLVSTSNRTNKNTKQIDQLKAEFCSFGRRLTKNILGDGTSGPTDGQEGGIEQRPCPANGDEWVDPVTGTRYIFQDCVWHLVPCCTQFTGPTGVDLVSVYENGVMAPFRLVAAPGQTGKYIWCQTGAAGEIGEWVNEDLHDASNFLGTGPTGTPMSGIQLNGMTRPPIDGDQWYNILLFRIRSSSYIYQNGSWVEVPCCVNIASISEDITSIIVGENESATLLVEVPEQIGTFVWNQSAPTIGGWTAASNFDAANFLGTGPTGTPMSGIQLNGMPRTPINGDQWYKDINDGFTPQRSVSYIYQNNAWVEAPCCVGFQPVFSIPESDLGNLYIGEGIIPRTVILPPDETGIFLWNQFGLGVGSWTATSNYDAANFIGATGVTAGTIPNGVQLDGMTRPPINGDQWYNILDAGTTAERSVDYIYKNGGWTGVPCCVAYDDPCVVTNNVGTLYVGEDPAHKVVQPPTENTGTYLWQQNVTGSASEGVWTPVSSPFVSVEILATGVMSGSNILFNFITSDIDNLYNPMTGKVTINEPGNYLINSNILYFVSATGFTSIFPYDHISINTSIRIDDVAENIDIESSIIRSVTTSLTSNQAYILNLTNGQTVAVLATVTNTDPMNIISNIFFGRFQVKKFIQP